MSIEATAEALVTDTPVAQPEPQTETAPMSEDDALSAAFDKFTAEPEADETPDPEVLEAPAGDEDTEEPAETESVEPAPSDLPRGVRDAWNDIPEHARDAIAQAHRELTAKLGHQGRLMAGISPIRDVLVEATKQLPQLADMTPQQVAREVFGLAKLSHDFTARPVETLMGYIKQHGLQEQMAAALTGQQAPQSGQHIQSLNQEIRQLKAKLEQVTNPEYLRSRVSQYTTETQVLDSVTKFAETAEHWGAVEDHMPAAIQFVQAKLGESASPQDVLSQAYELAVSQFVPDAKAKTPAADEAATTVNPEKTKAQIRAKSVNVKSTPVTKQKSLSEDELLSQVWEKSRN